LGQQTELTAGDGGANDNFGVRVSLSGDGNTALVGAYGHDTPAGADAGSVYLFVRTGGSWTQQAELTADDGAASDWFGDSVSLSGDGTTALVGAPYDDTAAGTDAGSAYVFAGSGSSWSQQIQLTAGYLTAAYCSSQVVVMVRDAAGNSVSVTYTTCIDNMPPEINCKNVTVNLDGTGHATIVPADVYQSGSDNCGTVNLVSVVPNSFDCSKVGPNTVTLSANDGHGNTANCTATVTVQDLNLTPILYTRSC
jgi:hypothetical protein